MKILENNLTIEKQNKVELETENSSLRQKIDLLTHQLNPCKHLIDTYNHLINKLILVAHFSTP